MGKERVRGERYKQIDWLFFCFIIHLAFLSFKIGEVVFHHFFSFGAWYTPCEGK